jgi:hypothetical protein
MLSDLVSCSNFGCSNFGGYIMPFVLIHAFLMIIFLLAIIVGWETAEGEMVGWGFF